MRGKKVFAERCARCHSSKLPVPAIGSPSRLRRLWLFRLLEEVLAVDENRGI